jgi:hypothetical protein
MQWDVGALLAAAMRYHHRHLLQMGMTILSLSRAQRMVVSLRGVFPFEQRPFCGFVFLLPTTERITFPRLWIAVSLGRCAAGVLSGSPLCQKAFSEHSANNTPHNTIHVIYC